VGSQEHHVKVKRIGLDGYSWNTDLRRDGMSDGSDAMRDVDNEIQGYLR
jgi:hypothetical protein